MDEAHPIKVNFSYNILILPAIDMFKASGYRQLREACRISDALRVSHGSVANEVFTKSMTPFLKVEILLFTSNIQLSSVSLS